MYPHQKFVTEDVEMIKHFIELLPLANVLPIDHEDIQSSYLPLIYQEN